MGVIATFEPIKNINRVREYKSDTDGYYKMQLGGVGTYNSAGAFYTSANEVLDLFNDSSTLQRRISNGSLYAEAGHPKFNPGMTIKTYMRRLLEIDEKNHIAHIRKIEIENKGSGAYTIWGWVKPLDNELGRGLKSKLDNPHANVAFSIRSFTMDKNIGGVIHKTLKQIITFDYVTEPGISNANKWDTVGVESISIDLEDIELKDILTEVLEDTKLMGIESDTSIVSETICLLDTCKSNCEDIISEW